MAIGREQHRHTRDEPGPTEPLISHGIGVFEFRNRPRQDVGWLVAYVVTLASAVGGGIYSFLHRNTRYDELIQPSAMGDPGLCPITATSHAVRRLLQEGPDAAPSFNFSLFMRAAGAWMGASAGGAILVGLLFLWLVRARPGFLVWLALGLQVAIPAALGGLALWVGAVVPAVFWLLLAGLMVLLFVLWKPQIELVTSLLGLSGRGISANPGLVPLALGLQVGLLALLEMPLLLAAVGAYMNGTLTYNAQRRDEGAATIADQCVDADGNTVSCCVWQTEPWVPGFLALAGIAMTWSLFLAFQIKYFTVAGTIAQWYFQPAAPSLSAAAGQPHGGSRTLRSLRFAVGPSLGSLCCGAAVLTLVSIVRQAMEKARKERGRNLLLACAAACLSLLLALLEFVTRFATVRAAITGEAFFAAGRGVVGLLKRNAMDAFGVWWLPPMIMQTCSFLLSVCWAVAVYFLSLETTWSHQKGTSPDQAHVSAIITAVVGLLAAWVVLGFLASLLLNVVDALFVCFAMDRDMGQVSSIEVYEVFIKLPTVGAVVQQPDGGLVYGAPPAEQEGMAAHCARGSAARV